MFVIRIGVVLKFPLMSIGGRPPSVRYPAAVPLDALRFITMLKTGLMRPRSYMVAKMGL